MTKLEEPTRGAPVTGILPDCVETTGGVKWYGSAAIELTYKDPAGEPNFMCCNRDRELILAIGQADDGPQKRHYGRQHLRPEPDLAMESVNYQNVESLAQGQATA